MYLRTFIEEYPGIIYDDPWFVIYDGFDPIREREVESLQSFGNGYIGTRNSLEEFYDLCDPATFVAGVYKPTDTEQNEELAKVPDWTRIQIFLEDEVINLNSLEVLEHKRYLDMKRGIVSRRWKTKDSSGRITNIAIVKFISLANKYAAFKSIIIKPENYTDKIRVVSGIDGKNMELVFPLPETRESNGLLSLGMMPKDTNQLVIVNQVSEFSCNKSQIAKISPSSSFYAPIMKQVKYDQQYKDQMNYEEWEWVAEYDCEYSINSLVTFFYGVNNEMTIKNNREYMENLLQSKDNFYVSVQESHIQSWDKHWDNINLTISGDSHSQKCVNFAIYHLINSGKYSGNYTSIPARNLSGEAYKGHIFWDTEIYMLPFFTFTDPSVAKDLLMYRYNTLPGARKNAKNEGVKGASFAWESTDSGIEEAPTEAISPFGQVINIYTSEYENHISPDIAYAIWQYWQVTGDDEFLVNYGSEIVFETARFCESLLSENEDGYYHIYDVVGPDEYHELVDDNAYTNIIVQNNFDIALKLSKLLNNQYKDEYEKLKKKISLQDKELELWSGIKDKIYINFDPESKLYEQFAGYFDLEYINVKDYKDRTTPMDVILGRERTRNSQVIKQPDVLMFLYLLADKFPQDIVEANYDFYEPRTGHGSSLSPSIYSAVAARLGKIDQAYNYFKQAAEVDLYNNMGNASGGIHMAAMGGVWQAIVMGFAGMYIYDEGLMLDPHLPDHWENLEFSIYWHGQKVNLQINKDKIILEIIGDKKVNISVGFDNWRELDPNNTYSAHKVHKWCWR
ncbi:MAG: hypothetical protein A2287_02520 [Candidatus Melainabacteria bacterium RIFOXYA12_FULL_32_12]|nr:MAG: hypothetical protein A2255_00355 [Candidatus Melainabacteria bacterium RIFOXYA2_FULL_32_9]OGI30968.1 MAG: hypothetical protein A2287_02520 [Candidatus Melainabacteria bacterium RIFOXYA12_FULL_32_12]